MKKENPKMMDKRKAAERQIEPEPTTFLGKMYASWKAYQAKKKQKPEPKPFTGDWFVSWTKTIIGAIIVVMIINGLAIASFVVPTGSMENTVMTGDFLFVNKFIFGPSTPQVVPFVNIPLPFLRFPGLREPRKGDVIVFIFPGYRDEIKAKEFQYYLKRCVAVAGDTLEIKNKRLFVNHIEYSIPTNGRFDPSIPLFDYNQWQTFPPGKGFTRNDYGPVRIPKKGDIIRLNQQNLREWFIFICREGHEVTSDGTNIFIDGKVMTSYKVERDYCFGMGDNRDNSLDSRYWGFIPVENVVGTPLIVYWSWDTNLPLSNIFGKLTTIRWGRLGTLIN
ncbi:MAG: Signal peptidase [Bacteroidota bacterium]|nr:Signal peptidase [Bacteroidota bacterium]